MRAHHTRNHDERVRSEQAIAEGLLPFTDCPWSQPARIWERGWLDYVDSGGIRNFDFDKGVRHRVERVEAFVYAHLHDRCGRIN